MNELDFAGHDLWSRVESGLQNRRAFLRRMASGVLVVAGGAALLNRMDAAAFAQALTQTPWQTEGPFYPDLLPLDSDNDLLIVSKHLTPAVGEVTHLSGRILDARGAAVTGATIEIWQVDHNGVYLNSRDNNGPRDGNFQGYGRFETGKSGEYRFRTIKPVAYPGRTPHIHVKVWKGERHLLTTQIYVRGDAQNERDGVLQSIRNRSQRAAVIVPFAAIPGSKIGELAARFDIILGWTPPA
jgi:protocatechuate 3,4-dioxygenase beta subunit